MNRDVTDGPQDGTGETFRDGLGRSVRLFRMFLQEQTDPEGFYTLVADDAVHLVSKHTALAGQTVVDFGGGSGFYSEAFTRAGARALVVDSDAEEVGAHARRYADTVIGRAEQPPLREGSLDLVFSSNLLEHVADLPRTADAMARLARPGGLVVLSYTAWLGPWGGHETSPWHYLGGHRARRRYEKRHGHLPKNVFGSSMYAASVKQGLRWAEDHPWLELVEARPRYLPPWMSFVLRMPILREFLTWNLWLVLRRKG